MLIELQILKSACIVQRTINSVVNQNVKVKVCNIGSTNTVLYVHNVVKSKILHIDITYSI